MTDNVFTRILDGGVRYEEDQRLHRLTLTAPDGTILPESALAQWSGHWLKTLQIELTDRCNERCLHCYIPNHTKDRALQMSAQTVKDLLRQFRAMNGLRIIFSGGETLLHPDIMDLLGYARELDLMLFLHTNALTLTESQAQRLGELRMFNVQVSLYSHKAAEHEAITCRKGSWQRTIDGLRKLARHHVPVTISCPIMRQNVNSIESLHALAASMGFECYFDDIMMARHDGDTGNLQVRIAPAEMPSLIERMIRLRPDFMEAIRESKSEDELLTRQFARRMNMCGIMSSGMCIDSDGTAYPCAGWNGMRIGNIHQTPLAEIWSRGDRVAELRSVTPKRFDKCGKCTLHNFCDMCVVYNYNENADITTPCAAFCQKASITKSVVMKIYNEHHNNG